MTKRPRHETRFPPDPPALPVAVERVRIDTQQALIEAISTYIPESDQSTVIGIVREVATNRHLSREAKLAAYLAKLEANTRLQGQYAEKIAAARTLLRTHLNGEWKDLVAQAEAHPILQPMIKGGLA